MGDGNTTVMRKSEKIHIMLPLQMWGHGAFREVGEIEEHLDIADTDPEVYAAKNLYTFIHEVNLLLKRKLTISF